MELIYNIKQKVADLYYSVRDLELTKDQILGATLGLTLFNTASAGVLTGLFLESAVRGDAKGAAVTGVIGALNALIAVGCYKAYKQEESREPKVESKEERLEWIRQNVLVAMFDKNHKWDL